MAEVDPVILQLRADVDRYIRDVRRASGDSDQRIRRLEAQFRRSSSAISLSLSGIAGTLATAFTGRELVGLIDSFTRLQNQLKVAGLEGEQLASVQERLRVIGRTYGADLESLASTFSRIAQVQGDLGASTEDVIRLNEIVAASLKVAGTDAQAASGALLQLGQALGSGTVRAEEFNSILEGALPLAQAAARGIEGYGGSVAKLRAAIAEGKVTSQEFFQGVLRGGVQTIEDAERATLTLSGAFTALRNELVTYVGSNASATGATGLLSNAIGKLADNLDVIIPALATIAALLGVRFVTALGQAALANVALQGALAGTATQMGVLGAASFALQARLAGAATTTEALTFALAGLRAVAAGALIGGLIYLAVTTEDAAAATERLTAAADEAEAKAASYEKRLRDAGVQVDATGKGADIAAGKVAGFAGQMLVAADAALKMAEALRIADLAKIGSRIQEIDREAARLSSIETNRPSRQSSGSLDGLIGRGVRDYVVPLAERITGQEAQGSGKRLAELQREKAALERQAILIGKAAEAGVDLGDTGTPTVSTGTTTPSGASRARQGPDLAAIELRFRDELDSIRLRVNQAELQRATTAEERAELEGRLLEIAEDQALRSVDADEDYSQIQKDEIKARLAGLGEAERDNIAFRLRAEKEREALDILDERGRSELDSLRLQFDLADTEKERRAIALKILDAENELLRARLQAVIDSETAQEIEKQRARIALEALNAQEGAQRASTERQFESPLARFARSAKDTDQLVEQAAVRRIEDLNQTITDAMTNALGIKDPFLSQLIKIFLDKNVFGPLAEALSSQGGGGGGGLFGSILNIGASLFGRSSGGFVQAGRPYRVNEGASVGRVEAFVPNTNGQIIPLGRMNAMQSGGSQNGGVAVVRLQLSGDLDARIESVSSGVAVEVVKASAQPLIDAAANETFRRANRRTL